MKKRTHRLLIDLIVIVFCVIFYKTGYSQSYNGKEIGHVCGTITQDTSWSGTISVDCDIFVPDTVTLTIEAGTVIEFQGAYKMEVEGFIHAFGTRQDSIIFTTINTTNGWRGLEFINDVYYSPAPSDTTFIKFCKFEFGKAIGSNKYGGAIYVNGYGYKLKIENSGFFNNHADYYGGALYVYNASPEINNNIFVNNSASTGGAMYLRYCSSPVFMNNFLAQCGKSIFVGDSDVTFTNLTSSNNSYHVYSDDSEIDFVNSIFWNDSIPSGTFDFDMDYYDSIKFVNSNIQGLRGNFIGNFDDDQIQLNNCTNYNPVFENNYYSLSTASPLLNLGNNIFDTINLVDINSNPRIYAGNNALIDMGAFELQEEPTNRTPIIESFEAQHSVISSDIEMPINFIDLDVNDTHTITVESDNSNVNIAGISGNTSGSFVLLHPEPTWSGSCTITITVTDNSGEENASSSTDFTLLVSDEICGLIRGNTTWNYPHIKVTCDVVVDSNATLTILPGTKIEFQNTNKMEVYGNIIAAGAPTDSILFTLPEENISAGWRGIRLSGPGKDSSVFNYCVIEYVKASTSYPEDKYGALTFKNQEGFIIQNSRISNNSGSYYGGGIQSINSVGKIVNNTIKSNSNITYGGGIYSTGSYIVIDSNSIANNLCNGDSYTKGGAICSRFDSLITIKNNTIQNNEVYTSGGGICVENSTSIIIGNIISYNSSNRHGGGLEISGKTELINNLISHNIATMSSSSYDGGGGIKLIEADANIINNTIGSNNEYGIYISNSRANFVNNIFASNIGHYYTSGYDDQIYIRNNGGTSEIQFNNCLIEGGAENIIEFGGWDDDDERLQNCIYESPLFLDVEYNNFALDFNSPAYNSGTADTLNLLLPTYDLRGNNRIIDDTVDLGAYEFNHTIDNRIPKIKDIPYYIIRKNDTLTVEVFFTDADTADSHQIFVSTDSAGIQISEVNGNVSGSSFTVIPENDFTGEFSVKVLVVDNSGSDNDTARTDFKIFVGNNYAFNHYRIEHNFVWRTDTVVVSNNLILNSDKLLKINPGTVVAFNGDYKFNIKGQLLALGEENDSVVFIIHENTTDINWQGIYFDYNIHQSNNPPNEISEFNYCRIEHADYGLYLKHLNDIKVTNCAISNNKVGIFIEGGATIENCRIFNNSTNGSGAGIYARGYYTNKVARLYNNEIFNNQSTDKGGGVYLFGDNAIMLGNIIHHNTAINGGGIYVGGDSKLIINNTIANNFAEVGGGAYAINEQNIFINNIFQYNSVGISNNDLFIHSTGSNTIFYNNYISGGLDSILANGFSFEGEANKNFTSNSNFIDTVQANYNLADSSICINSGLMNPSLMFSLDTNAINRLNIIDNIDIGAIEFEGTPMNRLPFIRRTDNFSIRQDKISKIAINYDEYDIDDTISATIEFGNSNLSYSNLLIQNNQITFNVEPLNNWSGNTNVTITILDASQQIGISNQKTYQMQVSNTYEVCGVIIDNTIWDADIIKINCNVEVDKNAILTISPGTIIQCQSDAYLTVNGVINALGTPDNYITFTSIDSTWGGININAPFQYSKLVNDTSVIEYCILENSNTELDYNSRAAINIYRSSLILSNSIISNNSTSGVYVSSQAIIKNNLIANNQIGIQVNYGSPIIKNNIIENNYRQTSEYIAGGIQLYYSTSPIIHNNIIRFNEGGGIRGGNYGKTAPEITNNVIHGNTPFENVGGGGIYIFQLFEPATINGNLIYNNSSTHDGGGLNIGYNDNYTPNLIINNTIVNNTTNEEGGGVYFSRNSLNILKNNIIWGNTAGETQNQIDGYNSASGSQLINCLVEQGPDGIAITIDSILNLYNFAPDFIDADNNDFKLSPLSQSINKGLADTSGLKIPTFDFFGSQRISYDTIDLGAAEYHECNITETSITEELCQGDPYLFGSQNLSSSGEYVEVFQTDSGCDSIVNLNLTVNPSFYFTQEASVCEGESYSFGNQIITSPGEYSRVLQTVSGCDSIINLNLSVSSSININEEIYLCQGDTYLLGNQTISEEGTYTETFQSASGCDSIVTITAFINPTYNETETGSMCNGEEYSFGNQTLTETGEYTELFQSASGCDSLVTLSLTVNPSYNEAIEATVCDGQEYVFGDQVLSQEGTYTEQFQSISGCDSTVTLTLSKNPTYYEIVFDTICQGEEIIFGTQTITEPGEYIELFQSINGCDSVVKLTLWVNSSFNETAEASICDGEGYAFRDQWLTEAGQYTETFQSITGCDSLVSLTLNINPAYDIYEEVAICHGDIYMLGTQALTESGTYTQNYKSIEGCDSILTLALDVNSVETGVLKEGNTLTAELIEAEYQWISCEDTSDIEGAKSQSFIAKENGEYAVVITQHSCIDTSSCYSITGIAVVENEFSSEFKIYPNPTNGFLSLETEIVFEYLDVTIINSLGQPIIQQNFKNQNNLKINLSELTDGIYTLVIKYDSQQAKFKIIKN